MEQQTLEFITFCTEMYAAKKDVSGSEVAKMFCDFGVFDFLEENYLELPSANNANLKDMSYSLWTDRKSVV